MDLIVHHYGNTGPRVIVLHGGPGAAGSGAPIAKGLSDTCRVMEPWQRTHSEEGLTVARHVADLDDLITSDCQNENPIIAGESWGAMLALAYAATHPDKMQSLVLIGCGTFDKVSRAKMNQIISDRLGDEGLKKMEQITRDYPHPKDHLPRQYELIHPVYNYETVIETSDGPGRFDAKAHQETWDDMLKCQEEGLYPQHFTNIKCPVLMIHGDYDPHPGKSIRDVLLEYMPQLVYIELEKCGHSPWAEKWAKDRFFEVMNDWIFSH